MAERTALVGELRELFGRTAYSHKSHERMADWLDAWHRFWYWLDVVLIAVGATGIVTSVAAALPAGWSRGVAVIAAVANTGALCVTLYSLKSDAERRIAKHREAATELWRVREQLTAMLTDLHDGALAEEEARRTRDELHDRLKAIYAVAPQTNSNAYAAAQKALQVSEDLTFSDAEIDSMLPGALRTKEIEVRK